jgi:hypothetical protein
MITSFRQSITLQHLIQAAAHIDSFGVPSLRGFLAALIRRVQGQGIEPITAPDPLTDLRNRIHAEGMARCIAMVDAYESDRQPCPMTVADLVREAYRMGLVYGIDSVTPQLTVPAELLPQFIQSILADTLDPQPVTTL